MSENDDWERGAAHCEPSIRVLRPNSPLSVVLRWANQIIATGLTIILFFGVLKLGALNEQFLSLQSQVSNLTTASQSFNRQLFEDRLGRLETSIDRLNNKLDQIQVEQQRRLERERNQR